MNIYDRSIDELVRRAEHNTDDRGALAFNRFIKPYVQGRAPVYRELVRRGHYETPTVSRVLLLGCVATKGDERARARDLYMSTLWRKRVAYAEASGHPWLLLSAAHGVISPLEVIDPYDTTISNRALHWSYSVNTGLEHIGPTVLEVHAGAPYVRALIDALEIPFITIEHPVAGMQIGELLRWYNEVTP